MEQFIKDIFRRDRISLPVHRVRVAIVSAYEPPVKSITTVDSAEIRPQWSDPSGTVFRVAKQVFIMANSEKMVSVPTLQAGLHYFAPHPNPLKIRYTGCI